MNHGKVPDEATVLLVYPNYTVTDPSEPLKFYADRVADDHLKILIAEAMSDLDYDDYMDGQGGGEKLHSKLSEIVVRTRQEVPIGDDHDLWGSGWDLFHPVLEARKTYGAIQGIPTGFPSFDQSIGGLQNERLYTLMGIPKSGKSSMALRMAMNASLSGARTLFVTFEMSNDEQRDRVASLLGRIPLSNILQGNLLPAEEKKLEVEWRRMNNMSGFLTLVEDKSSMTTLDGLNAKILKFQPKLVVVDGAYMMDDQYGEPPGTPRALTNITRGLKRLAQNTGLPVLITTQALEHKSKGGLNSNSAGYSSSFAQDSDVLCGVEALKDAYGYSLLKTILNRTGPPSEVYVHMGWDQGVVEEVPQALIPTAKPAQPTGGSSPLEAA